MVMGKKLENNGLWESSRMIIPQHKEALLKHQREQHRNERPELDEQAMIDISQLLERSMLERDVIGLELYDPFERQTVRGIVVDIDMIGRRIRLRAEDGERYWIKVEDILNID